MKDKLIRTAVVIGEFMTKDKAMRKLTDWAIKENVKFSHFEEDYYLGKLRGICLVGERGDG